MPLEGNTGISGAFGIAAESAWGTSVAPTAWFPFLEGESLGRQQNFVRSKGIRAGRTFVLGSQTVATTRTAGGSLPIELGNQGFGKFLNLLHGLTVTPTKIGAGTAYKQVHKIGTSDPYNKSVTLVKGAPKTEGGTVDSYCYPGSVFDSVQFQLATSGLVLATMAVQAKDENTEQTIGTPTYAAGLESFNFVNAIVKINSVEQTAIIRDLTVTIAKPTDGNRFFVGSAARQQPLTNGFTDVKIAFTTDYKNNTLYKFFEKAETKSVEIAFVGGIASEANKFELKLEFPMCRFEGDSPNIENLGALGQKITLMAEDNGTEAPCTATYVSTDSAL